MFGLRALVSGTLAIDIAIVAKFPRAVVEQKLMADFALRGHKEYRAGVNLVIIWRDRDRSCMSPFYILFIQEQAKREKGR